MQRRVHVRLVLEDVEPRAGNAPLGERADQRRLVDDGAARGVDEKRRRLHQPELARADQMARLRR